MKGLITNIQRFSLHDGPGIRTTIFLKGCPLSCAWCQNPETISSFPDVMFVGTGCVGCKKCIEICPNSCFSWENEISFVSENCSHCGLCVDNCPVGVLKWSSYEISVEEVLKEVLKDKDFYDISNGGITISGGEPLQQFDFCYELASSAKSLGLHVTLDTSGYCSPDLLKRILDFVDLFLFDIKSLDDESHKKWTKKSHSIIISNFKMLASTRRDIIVRVPLIPGLTDKKENLSAIMKFVDSVSQETIIEFIPFNELAVQKHAMLGRKFPLNIRG